MHDEKNYDTVADMLRSGAILREYGSTYFASVNLVPQIHKVRFSVVKLGTGGEDCADVWLDMDVLRRLCEDIDSGTAAAKIKADMKNSYPGAYKYVTGENGSKRLNIGGGEKGVRVQTQISKDGSWNNRMTIVSFDSLRDMSFYFKLVLGLIPCTHYYKSLVDEFWAGVEERKKYDTSNASHGTSNSKQEDGKENRKSSSSSSASAAENVPDQKKDKNDRNDKDEGSKPQEAASDKPAGIRVKNAKEITKLENGYSLTATKEDGSVITVQFSPESVTEMGESIWKKFSARCATPKGAEFAFVGKKISRGGEIFYLFHAFV